MHFIKIFLEEKKGVGILEYVLLLALLGTVVSVTVPPVREQIGIMYDNQVTDGEQFVGSIESDNATRVEINTPAPITVSPPSVENTNGPTYTPDPVTPVITPETKTVMIEVKKTDNNFDEQFVYDQDGFYGVLNKKTGGLTETVVDQQLTTERLDHSDSITNDSPDNFVEQYELSPEEGPDGFSGTMTAVSDVRKVLVTGSESTAPITKDSGNIILSRETESTDMTYVDSLFPAQYDYVEIDSNSETETGYEGTLSKSGSPQRTTIGTVTSTDTRVYSEMGYDSKDIDVTAMVEPFSYELVSPTKGNVATNPNTYPSTYHYDDGVKEGVLKFYRKNSRAYQTVGTFEYYAEYRGVIFPKQETDVSVFRPSYEYFDGYGYSGTVYLDENSVKSKLNSVLEINRDVGMIQQKVYTPGTFPSSVNNQTYDDFYAYDDGNGRVGSLSSPVKGSEFSHSTQSEKNVSHYRDFSSNSTPATYNYNVDGFSGVLSKSGEATVVSGSFIASDSKTVSGHTSSDYNVDGYSGTLSPYVYSGTYTPMDSKDVSHKVVVHTGSFKPLSVPETYEYAENGYSGTLTKVGEPVPFDDGSTGGDVETCPPGYTCNDVVGDQMTSTKSYTITPLVIGGPQPGTTYGPGTQWTQEYTGNVFRPANDTRIWRYEGTVSKPAIDTRVWRQYYTGNVIGPEVDYYRHFATYSGNVYEKSFLAEYGYEANFSGDLTKTETVTNYRYNQVYNGVLSKDSYNFEYVYVRDYAGTLFKSSTKDIIEYAQQYEGTVTERR